MVKLRKATLRYFAKFKGDFGYLRAIVRYGTIRKAITTPVVITREQLSRFNTLGSLNPKTDRLDDARLEEALNLYTAAAWDVINTIIASGNFETFPRVEMTKAIMQLYSRKESEI